MLLICLKKINYWKEYKNLTTIPVNEIDKTLTENADKLNNYFSQIENSDDKLEN